MGIWNWHREDKIHKNVLKIYPDYEIMRIAFHADSFLYQQIDDSRYISHNKKLIDVGDSTVKYSHLDNIYVEARGGKYDLIIAYCILSNGLVKDILLPTIYETDGKIIRNDGSIITAYMNT
jgi:hypothetical protein